jgi:small subunit ribosomal protein S15
MGCPFLHLCYYICAMLTKTKKQKIIKEVGIHDKDTGSPEVQISLLTKKIEELTSHLKKHQKDKHSRRGLLQMVADRQAQMKYLEKKSTRRYNALLKRLELKKK